MEKFKREGSLTESELSQLASLIMHARLDNSVDQPEFDWHEDANCRGEDPEIFFPRRGDPTKAARAICAACDVQVECLDFSVETNEKFGIWGGTVERERKAIRRKRRGRQKQDETAA